jgi:hypothetical protein
MASTRSIEPLDDGRSLAERSFDAMQKSFVPSPNSAIKQDDDGGGFAKPPRNHGPT